MSKKGSCIKNCINCNKKFHHFACEKTRKFCCKACHDKHKMTSIEVLCKQCSSPFIRIQSELRRHKNSFCSTECYHNSIKGSCSHKYKGGNISSCGYKVIYVEQKKIFEHRHLMEQFLNRKLYDWEIVHHINGNKLDNRLENLQITERTEHGKLHTIKHWSRNYERCIECHETSRHHEAHGYCMRCYQRHRARISAANIPQSETQTK